MKRGKRSEKLGERARRIRRTKMKEPILRAVVLHPNGEPYKCNNQDTIIPEMSISNQLHQQQCQDTHFITSPMLENFGYLANKQFAQQLINGSYIALPGTSEFAIEFLNTLQWKPSLEETDLHLTPEINQSSWKKQKERTASEPSTLVFNHYNTSCLDPTLNDIDTFLHDTLLAIDFSSTAWSKVTDLQILKKIGVFHICIQLMDA